MMLYRSMLNNNTNQDKIEIIIVDAGSTDGTLDLIGEKLKDINYRVFPNPLKTGEAGKAVGVKQVKNEITALIDSDNILPDTDWLKSMVEPFKDPEIIASEPISYTYRRTDSYITRYCALIGMNDPVCLFMGNYDRFCILTNKWTEVPHLEEDKGSYLKISFPNPKNIPTIGANGFLIRSEMLKQASIGDYLFDIDILYELISKKHYKIAKVKKGIVHVYCDSISQFIRKQRRRIRDYAYYQSLNLRKYPWSNIKISKLVKFCVYTVLVIPLIVQMVRGFIREKDVAWLFHPIACFLTLWIYGYNSLKNRIKPASVASRKNWK